LDITIPFGDDRAVWWAVSVFTGRQGTAANQNSVQTKSSSPNGQGNRDALSLWPQVQLNDAQRQCAPPTLCRQTCADSDMFSAAAGLEV
jgi:hypothetical protein